MINASFKPSELSQKLMTKIVLTTISGLEDISEREAVKLGASPVERRLGRIVVEAPLEFVYRANYEMRTVGKVYLLLASGRARTLEEVKEVAEKVDLTPFCNKSNTFGVKTTRVGDHEFTSIDISAAVGEVIKKNHDMPVYLDDPDAQIKVWMIGEEVMIGLNTSGEALHRRKYRIFPHPAPIKGNLAASLIYLSEWTSEDSMLDPMCGSGTILIEAAMLARKIPPGYFRRIYQFFRLPFFDLEYWRNYVKERNSEIEWERRVKLYGIEISPKHLSAAFGNACRARVSDTIGFVLGDARELTQHFKEVDFVITNPPYGIRMGRPKYVRSLYLAFSDEISKCNFKLGIAITAEKFMKKALLRHFELEERKIFYGDLLTYIFKFWRREE